MDEEGCSEDQAQAILNTAIDRGIRYFDTAWTYSQGQSEERVGLVAKHRRDEMWIATKVWETSRDGARRQLEESLARLQTDHVDLYYIHHVDVQTPLEEMLRALDDLVHQGKVRYIACSNYQAWRLCEALWISDHNGLARFEC